MKKTSDDSFEIAFYERVTKYNPRDMVVLELLGGLYSKQGEHAKTLRIDQRLVKLQPTNPKAHYNLACSLSIASHYHNAMESLQHAIELGYDDPDWMSEDPDLDPLKTDPIFRALIHVVATGGK